MKKQIEYQNEQNSLDKIEKFEKTFCLLTASYWEFGVGVQKVCETLLNPVNDIPITVFQREYFSSILISISDAAKISMLMVNNDYIPKEIFSQYLVAKNRFDICMNTIPELVEDLRNNKNINPFLVENLDKLAKEITRIFEEIDNFRYEIVA